MKNIEDAYILSPMQQGILFHSLLSPTSGVYVEQFSYEVEGELDFSAFEKAWQQVVDRHPILRTSFVWENIDQPHQVVCQRVKLPWQYYDWRGLTPQQQQENLEDFLICDRELGFQLTRSPLMRISLIYLSENFYRIIWSHHHLIVDGWSLLLVLQEVMDCYQALCDRRELLLEKPRPYRNYIVWLQQQNYSEAEAFWRERLKGFTAPTPLGLDHNSTKPLAEDLGQEEQHLQLSATTTIALQSFVRKHQLTLNTLVQGLWALLLSRYSGENDLVFGATSSGRPATLQGGASMIGLFINTLPVRVCLNPEVELIPWLQQIQTEQIEARQYEYSPLFEIQQWSEVQKGIPLFESIIVFQNIPIDASLQKWITNLKISKIEVFQRTNYPLTIKVETNPNLLIKIASDCHRFERKAIARMLSHWQKLLEAIIAKPQAKISELCLLTETEKQQILLDWNNTQVDYPQDLCIHQRFEQQVEKTPDAVALFFENQQLTYRELNNRANQLAHHLQELGVKPDTIVGICVERSLEMVMGILAILKAGGAYLPLDPAYPQERLGFMLADAQILVLLTQQHLVEILPQQQAQLLCLDTNNLVLTANQNQNNPVSEIKLENLAYVIYTSGSTGTPKGVMNTHLGLSNRLIWMQDKYQLIAGDRILQKTPFSFDVSVWEFFWPLITGASLVLAKPGGHQDSAYLVNLIIQEQISTLHFVPSMLQVFLEEPGLEKCNSIKRVICSGEALSFHLQERFFAHLEAELHNLYGPTEAAIDVTYWACQRKSKLPIVPIGRSIANTQVYILDQQFRPVPIGVIGELHIGGLGLARGYLNRPELTEQKFIINPFSKGTRLYKTGDSARYLPDGNIEYIGRIDHQVKIRGFRIELGEIETVLSQHSIVKEAVVLAKEDATGYKRLIAYVVPIDKTMPNGEIGLLLRNYVREQLPAYMVPSDCVILDVLPLTTNGKINRRALPSPDWEQRNLEQTYVAPRTSEEERLVDIWSKTLKVKQVGIHDNFFELGGHSLLATQVISKIRQAFQIELPLRSLFESPTVAEIVQSVEKEIELQKQLKIPPIKPVSRSKFLPLSYAQQRLWFITQLEPDSSAYNISDALQIQGKLQVKALEQSFQQIIQRHEILRTNFIQVKGQPTQVISSTADFKLPVIDLVTFSQSQRETEILRLITESEQRPFDLEQEPLLRVTLLRLALEEHILLFTTHHIISDGWSTGILIRELTALYEAFCQGQPSGASATLTLLPALPIQYADFAIWQREWLQGEVLETQLSYWKQQLKYLPPLLELPTDYPRPAVQSYKGDTQFIVLPKNLSDALQLFSQQESATLYMTLLAAFQTLLYRYTGQDDFAVGSPIANRNREETEGLIGFFVNTLVMRANLADNPSYRQLLRRVKEATLEAYAHQDLPFEAIVEAIQPERNLSNNSLFQVLFTLQNTPQVDLEIAGLNFRNLAAVTKTAQFDLSLDIIENEQGAIATLEYSTDLFDRSTIERMLKHFQILLENIVANPDQRLDKLNFLTDVETKQLLEDFNHNHQLYPVTQTIEQLFEVQVTKTPNAIAVICRYEKLTYQQLNAQANQLARFLQQLGVKSGGLIGIVKERDINFVVAILAIFKVGGVYLPIDSTYPLERIRYMVSNSEIKILLTDSLSLNSFQDILDYCPQLQEIVCLNNLSDKIDYISSNLNIHNQLNIKQFSPENLGLSQSGIAPAYMIYTSGSTGLPKGAIIRHGGAINHIYAQYDALKLTDNLTFLQSAPASSDISIWQFLAPLLIGGKTVIVNTETVCLPEQLLQVIKQEKITLAELVPVVLRNLLDYIESLNMTLRQLPLLQWMMVTGESVSVDLVNQWLQTYPTIPVVNAYGPTEAADDITQLIIDQPLPENQRTVPIGKPLANLNLYVLDRQMNLVPVGVPGEICVSGYGVGLGYWKNAENTKLSFLPHPFVNIAKPLPGSDIDFLYKTGDRGKWLADGNIEFLGRIDHQVKIRGFRIELGEIEAVLSQHPTIREAVVLATEEHEQKPKLLVAYIVPMLFSEQIFTKNSPLEFKEELRYFLKENLPDYMVPTVFIFLEAIPLTPNRKIDRQALLKCDRYQIEIEESFIPPQTIVEKQLAQIWSELLGVEQVGIHDNFFELGGDSILSLQVIAKANQVKLHLSPKQIFQYQTIAQLAPIVVTSEPNQAEQGLVTGSFPLTPIQKWFFEQNFPAYHHSNQAVLLETKQEIDPILLEQAMQCLLEHHDLLRVHFKQEQSNWQPLIVSAQEVSVTQVDLSAIPLEQLKLEIGTIANQFQGSLNLSTGILLRVGLFNLGTNQPNRLLIVIHHLIIDDVSWRILLEDLQEIYQQLIQEKRINLPAKTTSFKQWAERLQVYAQSPELKTEVDYWLTMLSQAIKPLPIDYPGADNRVTDARTISVVLSVEETQALLQEVPAAYRTQINDVLLTALVETFATWTGKRSLLFDLEGHGREELFEDIELSRTVGWFTSVFPVLLSLEQTVEAGAALKTIKEQLRRIPQRGIGYGLLRYLNQELEIRQLLSFLPQAEISFNYLGQFDQVLSESSLFKLASESSGNSDSSLNSMPYLLEINGGILSGSLQFGWTYSEKLYRRSTVETLAQNFIEVLRSLITHCQSEQAGGVTPSDFPLIGLTQEQLDSAFDRISF